MITLHDSIDGLVAANLEAQVYSDNYRHYLDPLTYAREFQTITVGVGRRSGKSTYIADRIEPDDVLIVPTHASWRVHPTRHEYGRNTHTFAASMWHPDRFRGMVAPRVYVDEFVLVENELLRCGARDLWEALLPFVGRTKQFIFLGLAMTNIEKMIRWSLFNKAVAAASRVTPDLDMARDAALKALEECGDAPDYTILRCAKSRAKDLVRSVKRQPQVLHGDMDLIAADDNVVDAVASLQRGQQMRALMTTSEARILAWVEAGYTNAEIAERFELSEETIRLRRKAAELKLETMKDSE